MSRFTVIACDQRSEMWYAARAGRATGSRADDMRAKGKGGAEATTRCNYRTQLIAERLTGQPQENAYQSRAMENGAELEPRAIAAYEALTGLLVRKTGFLAMTEYAAGCSLDGDVDNFRIVLSVKCPEPTAHLKYLWERRLPPKYVKQATHELWVTGAEEYHFLSYNESFPEHLQTMLVKCQRSEFDIATHQVETLEFLHEVDQGVAQMQTYKPAWAL